jgi:outer membrane protein assembly factor BamB
MNKLQIKRSSTNPRLPRECGDPVNNKLLEEVIYLLRCLRGFIINWIPAFARKTCGKLVCASLLVLMTVACNKNEEAIDLSKYEALDAGTLQLFAPDPALKNQTISIPGATKISAWPTSGGVLSNIPQNLSVASKPGSTEAKTYDIHTKFSKEYHFVGNTPVISGNKLFVLGDKSCLHAYDLSNLKKERWKITFNNTEEDVFRGGGIFASNNNLAVTHGSNSISVLDANTGAEKWKYMMSNISRTAPIIYRDRVFALTVDNKLYCLDLATGLLKWIHEGAAEQLSVLKTSSIVAYQDSILVPYSIGQVYAVSVVEGKQLWNLSLDEKFASIGDLFTPVINGDVAYISSFKGVLYALDLKTGTIIWNNYYAGGNEIWLAGSYIFSVNKSSQLSAINKFTGKVKWIQNLYEETISSRPILVNNELFVVSSEGRLLVFSPLTGEKLKQLQVAKVRYSTPIATQDGLFLLSAKGNLLVF